MFGIICSLERRKNLLTTNMLFLLRWEVEVSMIPCFLLVDLKMCCYQNEPLVMYACTSFSSVHLNMLLY